MRGLVRLKPEEAAVVFDLIHARRTVYRFQPMPLPAGVVEHLIEAATWAPNHRMTEPWRFVVVEGVAKEELAELRGELARRRAEREGRGLDRVEAQVAEFREPAVYLYLVQQVEGDLVRQREDYAACAIAAYIVQLAAWSIGIGVRWGTGLMATAPEVRRQLGLGDNQEIVCFLGLGVPSDGQLGVGRRSDHLRFTRYLGRADQIEPALAELADDGAWLARGLGLRRHPCFN